MIKFFYELTVKLKQKNMKVWPWFYKINKVIINLFYPCFQFFNKKYGLDENSCVIVSLTSFPERINMVWLTIATILNQNLKPKKIILWLAQDQFPTHKLPYSLKRLCKRGLEIQYCEDLKPHKKYFFTMKNYKESFIITIDDDMLYPEDFIENLVKNVKKYPNTIICNWAHKITFDQKGNFNPYKLWVHSSNEVGKLIVPIGCCGILYPPNSLNLEVFEIEKIKKLAFYCDDLWLKCMALKNNTLAVNVNLNDLIFFNNLRNQKSGLWKHNTLGENRNDKVWSDLMNVYKELEEHMKGEIRK